MAEKKSSEILLDLDNRIQNIEKQLKLQEFQLRIIIDNFNKLFKILPTEKALPLKITEVKEVAPITNQIEVQNNKIISNKDYNPEKEKRTPEEPERRVLRLFRPLLLPGAVGRDRLRAH